MRILSFQWGQPPFEGQPFEILASITDEEPTPPSDIVDLSPQIDDILLTCLATEKADRYESVLYLRDELLDVPDASELSFDGSASVRRTPLDRGDRERCHRVLDETGHSPAPISGNDAETRSVRSTTSMVSIQWCTSGGLAEVLAENILMPVREVVRAYATRYDRDGWGQTAIGKEIDRVNEIILEAIFWEHRLVSIETIEIKIGATDKPILNFDGSRFLITYLNSVTVE